MNVFYSGIFVGMVIAVVVLIAGWTVLFAKGESEKPKFHVSQLHQVAVATDYFWEPISTCPRHVKVQLLSPYGVAVYSPYAGPLDKGGWTHWAPLPKRREHEDPHDPSVS